MKFIEKMHILDLKREIRHYESKLIFLKELLIHFQKEYSLKDKTKQLNHTGGDTNGNN